MTAEGRIVAIVGNTGCGKTTLARLLGAHVPFRPLLEQSENRPFQKLFSQDLQRYALANQVDFLLYRAEQERGIRRGGGVGVHDGGLEMDFHVFTRLFFERGYLSGSEMGLCERLYAALRAELPPPDILVWLRVPLEVVAERYSRRGRALSIAAVDDMRRIDWLLSEWLTNERQSPVISVDAGQDDPTFASAIGGLIHTLSTALRI